MTSQPCHLTGTHPHPNYFLFLNQPIRNKVPIINAGKSIINEKAEVMYQGSASTLKIEDTKCTMPAIIKAIPPTISYFHDIHIITANNNAGILCINKAKTVCQKPEFSSKTSQENIVRNRTNIIDNILGVHNTNLLIFVTMK